MKTFPSRTSLFCLFLALCLAAAESAAAQSYKAEALSEPPPSELAAPVRNAVSATGIRVTGPSGARKSKRSAIPRCGLSAVRARYADGRDSFSQFCERLSQATDQGGCLHATLRARTRERKSYGRSSTAGLRSGFSRGG